MAFIRTKKVKEWKYAYLVENKWKQNKTKQKVKEYLGRMHPLENIVGAKFEKDINGLNFKESVVELVKFELMKNGFNEIKGNPNILVKNKFITNFEKGKFMHDKKPVVFESNEGFICSCTFEKIMKFKPSDNEEETGLKLAESILEAGISLPHEVFIKLFEKVHKIKMPVLTELDIEKHM